MSIGGLLEIVLKNLQTGVRKNDRPHIAAVGDQSRCLAEGVLALQQGSAYARQSGDFGGGGADLFGTDALGNVFAFEDQHGFAVIILKLGVQMRGQNFQRCFIMGLHTVLLRHPFRA